MNFSKKIILTLICAVFTLVTYAQREGRGGRMDPSERANQQTERMIKALDLSAAQGEKIKALNLEFAEKTKQMRLEVREAEGGREMMREKMQGLRTEHQTSLKKYLTVEQIEKWEKILAERPKREGSRKGRGGEKKKSDSSNG